MILRLYSSNLIDRWRDSLQTVVGMTVSACYTIVALCFFDLPDWCDVVLLLLTVVYGRVLVRHSRVLEQLRFGSNP